MSYDSGFKVRLSLRKLTLRDISGGITPTTIPNVLSQTPAPLASGRGYRTLDGLAIVSSIAASSDPRSAAQALRAAFDKQPIYPSPVQPSEQNVDAIVAKAAELLALLREGDKRPLVHHITVRSVHRPHPFHIVSR